MYYVYVLKSSVKDFVYVGYTSDLKTRLRQHNDGLNKSTKPYIPFILVYYEAYKDKNDAMSREYKLKHHGSSIGHLKKRIAKSIL